ncbi:MAG: dipicolinate synthase subunit B [Clostridia bacterium]|nr:dipicolinate synthase subunit B [Clostridia bacterium]
MTGFAFCGSFCNHKASLEVLSEFLNKGADILPIMSERVYTTDTRFGRASDFISAVENMTGKKVIHTIEDAEPIGPKIHLDALVICPCTGNTTAKMAHGICDTAVTMAAKAHLRNEKPLVIAYASNDALSICAPNIGLLLQRKNVYFVPLCQDDAENKPRSLVCDFSRVYETYLDSIKGRQTQKIFF